MWSGPVAPLHIPAGRGHRQIWPRCDLSADVFTRFWPCEHECWCSEVSIWLRAVTRGDAYKKKEDLKRILDNLRKPLTPTGLITITCNSDISKQLARVRSLRWTSHRAPGLKLPAVSLASDAARLKREWSGETRAAAAPCGSSVTRAARRHEGPSFCRRGVQTQGDCHGFWNSNRNAETRERGNVSSCDLIFLKREKREKQKEADTNKVSP